MPAETIIPGKGTILSIESAVANTYTTIGQRVSLDGPDGEFGTAETTHLDSSVRTRRATIEDPGKLSGKLYYDPNGDSHDYLKGKYGVVTNYRLIFADGKTTPARATFPGILTKLKPTGMEVDSNLEADFEVQITGAITWAKGS